MLERFFHFTPAEIALSNGNDFGIGDNVTGERPGDWLVRLAQPLPYPAAKNERALIRT